MNPDRTELLDNFNEAERVHRPHHLFHYSNLAFSVLGELVAQLDGREWFESLRARLLDPLGLTRTTLVPTLAGGARVLRAALHRRPDRGTGGRPEGTGAVRRAVQHSRRPRTLVGLRCRSAGGRAEPRHPRGDGAAADHDRHPQVGWRLRSRLHGAEVGRAHLRRAHRRLPGRHQRRVHRPHGENRGARTDEQFGVARSRRVRDGTGGPRHRARAARRTAVASGYLRADRARRARRGVVLRGRRLHLHGAAGDVGGTGREGGQSTSRPPCSSVSAPTCTGRCPVANAGSCCGSTATPTDASAP